MVSIATDICKTEKGYCMCLDLPGVEKKDICIDVEDSILTICARRPTEHENFDEYVRKERAFGRATRKFKIPSTVEVSSITSTFENGVLKVCLPLRKGTTSTGVHVSIA
jgi:HSP20 family protein